MAKIAGGRHLEFDPTGNGAVRSAVPENLTLEPNMRGSVDAFQSYGHLKFSQNVCMGHWALRLVGRRSVVNIHTSYTDLIYSSFATLET